MPSPKIGRAGRMSAAVENCDKEKVSDSLDLPCKIISDITRINCAKMKLPHIDGD